jgi:hypothetical protein
MQKLFWLFFLAFGSIVVAQENLEEEELVIRKMCQHLIDNKSVEDSIRINEAYVVYLFPYLDKQEESKIEEIANRIFFRYQKQCPEFKAILDSVEPLNSEEGILIEKPEKSMLTKNELKEFKNHTNYSYHFLDEITKVEISNGYWIETFSDGTYSKTKLEWLKNNSFKLVFIESNNAMKAGYSRAGEEYFYEIIRKEGNVYYIQTVEPGGKYLQFKLHIN